MATQSYVTFKVNGINAFYQTGQVTQGGGVDSDYQAFINATGITNTTIQSAINTLITDLKNAGIWTKMGAIYPMVGGSATTHKFNLKDPRDLDAAYRLVFGGGWTHSTDGATPNGTNAYADTFYKPSNGLLDSAHMSYYSRTSAPASTAIDMGSFVSGVYHHTHIKYTGDIMYALINTSTVYSTSMPGDVSQGLYSFSRVNSATIQSYKNGVIKSTLGSISSSRNNANIYLGAGNNAGIATQFGTKQIAFASLGSGLNDAENTALYTAVQKFNTTLGRQVGVPIVADTDAQAFLNAASITNTTQATAISTLVSNLKSAGIWTKMKAIYPFVGGTAFSHKFNLKDPRDLDVAYRLTFAGGGIHDINGYTGNTLNAYANTYLQPSSMGQNSVHISWRSNTNSTGVKAEIGTISFSNFCGYSINNAGTSYVTRLNISSNVLAPTTNSIGYYQASRTNSTNYIMQKDNTQTTVSATSNTPINSNIILMAASNSADFSNRNLQLVTIGDGLSSSEMNSLRTIETTYKTSLGR